MQPDYSYALEYDFFNNRKETTIKGDYQNYDFDGFPLFYTLNSGSGITQIMKNDPRGNTIVTPSHLYDFDLFNHLSQVDSGKVKFYYSASGQKIVRLSPDQVTLYFYDGAGQLALEKSFDRLTGRELQKTYYFYLNGQLIAKY